MGFKNIFGYWDCELMKVLPKIHVIGLYFFLFGINRWIISCRVTVPYKSYAGL